MRTARWILLSVVALSLGGLIWYRASRPTPVQVGTVVRGPLVVAWSADADCSGTVVGVACELGGTIRALRVREGSVVRRGEAIADVDAAEAEEQVRAARAEAERLRRQVPASVAAARARLRAAQARLARLEKGYRAEEVEAAEARVETARREVEAAEARIAELEALLSRERAASAAEVRAAEATLAAAEARLAEAKAGPRAEQIAAAEADLRGAEAAEERARKDLDRLRSLYEQQATSGSSVDAAEEAHRRAKSQADAARERVMELRRGTRVEQLDVAEADRRAAQAMLEQARAHARRVTEIEKSLQAARARTEQARSAHEEAGAQARLVRKGYTPEEVAAARAEVSEAQAAVALAQAEQSGVRAAEATLRQAEVHLAKARVVAPADGEVVRKLLDAGDYAAPGQPIVEMVAPTSVWVTALVDDQDISKVRVGQKVRVLSEAFPGQPFEGVVDVIGGAAHAKGVGRARAKVVPVRVEVTGAAGKLRPGMELDVEAESVLRDSALLVPNEALVQEGRLEKRRVEVGESAVEHTEVLSGVTEGLQVVTGEKGKLRPGQRVEVAEAAPVQ